MQIHLKIVQIQSRWRVSNSDLSRVHFCTKCLYRVHHFTKGLQIGHFQARKRMETALWKPKKPLKWKDSSIVSILESCCVSARHVGYNFTICLGCVHVSAEPRCHSVAELNCHGLAGSYTGICWDHCPRIARKRPATTGVRSLTITGGSWLCLGQGSSSSMTWRTMWSVSGREKMLKNGN